MIKLQEAISKDTLRPQLCYAKIENGFIVATDAHILVRYSLLHLGFTQEEADSLEGKYMDSFNAKMFGMAKTIKSVDGNTIHVSKGSKASPMDYTVKVVDSITGNYPNYQTIVDAVMRDTEKESGVSVISLNTGLLAKLTKLTTNKYGMVTISFGSTSNKPIVAHGNDVTLDEELILIMPVII